MQHTIGFAPLKTKQRALRDGFPQSMGLRVHRAISWIGRAEACEDPDGQFIFLWIAFNAAYADETEFQHIAIGERTAFQDYFGKLVAHDHTNRIYNAIWDRFHGPVRLLMGNKYLFNPYWQHHNGMPGFTDWSDQFISSTRSFTTAFQNGHCQRVLGLVFDRLYVLRNQLVHGGATWNSRVNRDQVTDGAAILAFLMPVFIDIMMDVPHADWGKPFYQLEDDGF